MRLQKTIREIENLIECYGNTMRVYYDAEDGSRKSERVKGFVQDFAKKSVKATRNSLITVATYAGVNSPDAKVIYLPFRDYWDSDGDIRIAFRDRMYHVVYDSITWVKDKPVYVWALIEPTVPVRLKDFENIDEIEVE